MKTYPNTPGHNNVHTSIVAAKSIAIKASSIRERIYALLLDGCEITSEEAAIKLGLTHGNCWKRCSELRAKGLLEDSGKKRFNTSSGKEAIVWRLRKGDGTDINYNNSKVYLKEKIASLEQEISRLKEENKQLNPSPSKQLTLWDY